MYRTVQLTIREQRLRSNEKQFQGGLVFKDHRLFVSLNSRPRVIKKKKKEEQRTGSVMGAMMSEREGGKECVYARERA